MTLIEAEFIFATLSMFVFAGLLIGKAGDPQRLPVRHTTSPQNTLQRNRANPE